MKGPRVLLAALTVAGILSLLAVFEVYPEDKAIGLAESGTSTQLSSNQQFEFDAVDKKVIDQYNVLSTISSSLHQAACHPQ
jgi:hypothetical protein